MQLEVSILILFTRANLLIATYIETSCMVVADEVSRCMSKRRVNKDTIVQIYL